MITVPGPIYLCIVSAGGAAWGYLIGSAIHRLRIHLKEEQKFNEARLSLREFLLEVKK